MTLLIFILVAVGIGYWLSRSKYQQSIDDKASQLASSSQSWSSRAENWWNSSVMRRNFEGQFTSWASAEGFQFLPDEFTNWYSELSESNRKTFTNQLESNFKRQNLEYQDLLQGKLENQPAKMQLYVEAIVVTSQEFRKTKEVEEPNNPKTEKRKPKDTGTGKKTAEKQTSRRRESNQDTSEAIA